MIDLIGKKRMGIIVLFFILTGLLAAGHALYLLPQKERLDRELNMTRAQAANKQADVARLAEEYKLIQEQKSDFQKLESAGFFSAQSRAVASRRIEDVQEFSRVLSARYTIDPAKIEKHDDAEKAGHVILSSPIKVNIDALDDIDIYNFIFWLENTLPGRASVKSLKMKKEANITEARLRGIGSGSPVVMVSGELLLDWQTIVPAEDVGQTPQ